MAALSSPGYAQLDGQTAVYLYIAAVEVNVLNCRESGSERRMRGRSRFAVLGQGT